MNYQSIIDANHQRTKDGVEETHRWYFGRAMVRQKEFITNIKKLLKFASKSHHLVSLVTNAEAKIQVAPAGDTAMINLRTSPYKIHLPITAFRPQDLAMFAMFPIHDYISLCFMVINGSVVHEALHALLTPVKDTSLLTTTDSSLLGKLRAHVNLIEDAFINTWGFRNLDETAANFLRWETSFHFPPELYGKNDGGSAILEQIKEGKVKPSDTSKWTMNDCLFACKNEVTADLAVEVAKENFPLFGEQLEALVTLARSLPNHGVTRSAHTDDVDARAPIVTAIAMLLAGITEPEEKPEDGEEESEGEETEGEGESSGSGEEESEGEEEERPAEAKDDIAPIDKAIAQHEEKQAEEEKLRDYSEGKSEDRPDGPMDAEIRVAVDKMLDPGNPPSKMKVEMPDQLDFSEEFAKDNIRDFDGYREMDIMEGNGRSDKDFNPTKDILNFKNIEHLLRVQEDQQRYGSLQSTGSHLHEPAIHRIALDGQIFAQRDTVRQDFDTPEIIILGDFSGSMGSLAYKQADAIWNLMTALKKANIPAKYYGHTSIRDYGSRRKETDQPVLYFVADTEMSKQEMHKRFSKSLAVPYVENYDGLILEKIWKKFESKKKNRLLFFFSDGAPCGSRYNGKDANTHTQIAGAEIRMAGATLAVVSLTNSVFSRHCVLFGRQHCINAAEGMQVVRKKLVEIVTKGGAK